MPDLPFVAKGITDVLTGQEKMRIGAKALADLYKQQNLEMAGAAASARSAVAGTLTEMEKIEKKIADVRAGMSKGVIDPAKGEESIRRLQKKLDDTKKASDAAGRSLAKAFGNEALGYLTRWAGPAGIVAGAMGTITSEMRSQFDLIDKTASIKMGLSASRNVVLRNLPGVDDATRKAILEENQNLASSTGVSEVFINQARAEALSASAGNRVASLEAVRGSAQFLFDRPSDIGGFAGSLLDLSKVTGTTDADVNIGLLTQVAGLSRVSDARKQATSIPGALIGMRDMGFSTAESAAIYAALTEFAADLTGDSSGTASIDFAKQLRKFTAGGTEGMTPGQKLAALQNDPDLRSQFLANFSAETKKLAPLEKLLDPASPVAQRVAENIGKVGDNESLRRQGADAIRGLSVNELNRQSRSESSLKTLSEQLAALDPTSNLTLDAREDLTRILKQVGRSNLGANVSTALARFGDDSIGLSVDEADNLIGSVASDLEDGVAAQTKRIGRGSFKTIPGREATPTELQMAALMRQHIEIAKETLAEQKRQGKGVGLIPTR